MITRFTIGEFTTFVSKKALSIEDANEIKAIAAKIVKSKNQEVKTRKGSGTRSDSHTPTHTTEIWNQAFDEYYNED